MCKRRRVNFMSARLKRRMSTIRNIPCLVRSMAKDDKSRLQSYISSKPDIANNIEYHYYYENKICEVCYSADDEDNLILCDKCDDAYHLACLTPKLSAVPDKDWICIRCVKLKTQADDHEDSEPAFGEKCTRCQDLLWDEFNVMKTLKGDHLTQTKTKVIVERTNRGIECKCCKKWFHDFCLNLRSNAINCSSCEATIRSDGPRSHQQFQEDIMKSHEQMLLTNQYLGINNHAPNDGISLRRAKHIGLKLPPALTDCMQMIRQEMTLYYALKSLGMKYVDGQVYNPEILPLSSNTAFAQKIINPLSVRDEICFKEFKSKSEWGNGAPIEIMENRQVGFYARAIVSIPAHSIISEYSGEVVPARDSLYHRNDSIMSLVRASRSSSSFDICPVLYGNISKFVSGINNRMRNWRYIENVLTLRFMFEGRVRLLFFAKRDIKAGETLYINYNGGAFQEYPTEHFVHS